MVEIQEKDYVIEYHGKECVCFSGILRLEGLEEYQPIMDLLIKALEQTSILTIDLTRLEFLNSSGISMFSMFIVKARKLGDISLTLKGSQKTLWQTKSLKNLQRLMPALVLEFV